MFKGDGFFYRNRYMLNTISQFVIVLSLYCYSGFYLFWMNKYLFDVVFFLWLV
jgi:hypothetical protein